MLVYDKKAIIYSWAKTASSVMVLRNLEHAHDDHHAHQEQDDVELRAREHLPERHCLTSHE